MPLQVIFKKKQLNSEIRISTPNTRSHAGELIGRQNYTGIGIKWTQSEYTQNI